MVFLLSRASGPGCCRRVSTYRCVQISGATSTFDGARFKWLSANVIETATGKTLLAPYGIKTFNGVRVAFIGMTLKGTPSIVTPTGVAGLTFRDEADTVNALVPQLRARGIEAIVVLVHQGGFQTSPNVGDINGCDGNLKNADGSDSDLGAIVKRLDNAVDLVISGHTHAAYNCSANTVDVKLVSGVAVSTPRPTGLANSTRRLVPVTSASAFGRLLTYDGSECHELARGPHRRGHQRRHHRRPERQERRRRLHRARLAAGECRDRQHHHRLAQQRQCGR